MPRRHFDVLVVGAGPAGSAAAIELAKQGARVALVDRHDFPRDKTCGDALIPDALKVLDRLSLKEKVLSRAYVMNKIRVYAPNRRFVDVRGECACLPRRVFDQVLQNEAVRHGAEFHPRLKLAGALRDGPLVRGAAFADWHGNHVCLEASVTILATGAAVDPLRAFGVCERSAPSAIATRTYVKADESFASDFGHLCISYDAAICPGYGWMFPGPDCTFNVGVGYFYDSTRRPPETNVRRLFEKFIAVFPPAVTLMKMTGQQAPLRGALIRTGLHGATLGVPGLLVVGEAAGLTYSFSGEGIGKAMESGLIAAEAVLAHRSAGPEASRCLAAAYSSRIRNTFLSRFRAYEQAQHWLSSPAVANLLAWRANRSNFVMRQLEGMFQETVDPKRLFSAAGSVRAFIS